MRTHLKPLAACSAAILFSLLLSGCFLASTEPFYERGKTVYDAALLGDWNLKNCAQNDDTKDKYCRLTVTPYEQTKDDKTDKGYHIAFRDEGGAGSEFDGFLFDLDGVRMLDTSVHEGPKVDVAFAVHVVSTHVLWKVALESGRLTLTPMKPLTAATVCSPWCSTPDVHPPLAHFLYEGEAVLTAPAATVQPWLAARAFDPQAWDDAYVWKKGPPPAAAAAPKPAPKRPKPR